MLQVLEEIVQGQGHELGALEKGRHEPGHEEPCRVLDMDSESSREPFRCWLRSRGVT